MAEFVSATYFSNTCRGVEMEILQDLTNITYNNERNTNTCFAISGKLSFNSFFSNGDLCLPKMIISSYTRTYISKKCSEKNNVGVKPLYSLSPFKEFFTG